MSEPDIFQRVGSIPNARVGSDFEQAARDILASQDLRLEKNFGLTLGIGEKKKERRFDLGAASPKVIVECKSHKWTASGKVPSAKMSVWNEAMYYFALAPDDYRKILFVLRDDNPKKRETLAEYYLRTYDHLIPDGVEFWEYDETIAEVTIRRVSD